MSSKKRICEFRLKGLIGAGAFGKVYRAINVVTCKEVAVKVESQAALHPQLLHEAAIYQELQGGVGIPKLIWSGLDGDSNVLVTELLGHSLEGLFHLCGGRFKLKTVLQLADQLISRIEHLHNKGFIHRDIKPDNFVMGCREKSHLVHIIDFGLSKKYRNEETFEHIPYRHGLNFCGTARYASVNTHLGIEPSRRDDLESIAYVLIFFLTGTLPWVGIKGATKQEEHRKILEKKESTPMPILCRGAPCEFVQFLDYCKSLEFDQKPDYGLLRALFRNIFRKQCFDDDNKFDCWDLGLIGDQYSGAAKRKTAAKDSMRPDDQDSDILDGANAAAAAAAAAAANNESMRLEVPDEEVRRRDCDEQAPNVPEEDKVMRRDYEQGHEVGIHDFAEVWTQLQKEMTSDEQAPNVPEEDQVTRRDNEQRPEVGTELQKEMTSGEQAPNVPEEVEVTRRDYEQGHEVNFRSDYADIWTLVQKATANGLFRGVQPDTESSWS